MMYKTWCGCPLRTGTIFIAVCYLAMAVIGIIICSFNVERITADITKRLTSNEEDGKVKYIQVVRVLVIAMSVFFGVQIIVNIMLVMGTLQENACFLLPWVVVYSLVVLVNLIVCAVLPAIFFNTAFSLAGIFIIIFNVCNIILTFYSLGAVNSYYKRMRRIHACIQ